MESLDNIIEEINKFDINIVTIDNVNDIFKRLDYIISICEDKILSCANKIDNEGSDVKVEVNNEVDDKLNEIMELTKETKTNEITPKKRTTRKQTPKTTTKQPKTSARASARKKKQIEEDSLISDD